MRSGGGVGGSSGSSDFRGMGLARYLYLLPGVVWGYPQCVCVLRRVP